MDGVQQPFAGGALADKPLAHLLVHVADNKLTGSLELCDGVQSATIVLLRGKVSKIRTSVSVCYLGSVLYELGFIDSAELDASLLQLSKRRVPHGQILIARGSIKREQLEIALCEQTLRKLTYLFSFGADATFAFHDNVDLLPTYGGQVLLRVDPFPAVWRGIRDFPPAEHLRAALARLGSSQWRLASASQVHRFRFPREELAVVECLRITPMSMQEIHLLGALPPANAGLLLYCLHVSRQIEAFSAPTTAARRDRRYPASPAASGTRPVTRQAPRHDTDARDRAGFIRERARTIPREDYFERLSVARDATSVQIDREFAALASIWKPDALPQALEHVRKDCARVFLYLAEAYETLSDPRKRSVYQQQLVLGQAAHYDPTADLAASGAKTALEGARLCMVRGDLDRAERLARSAHEARPSDASALALLVWVEAQHPLHQHADATRARLAILDRAVALDSACQDAYYYRAQLHARLEDHRSAVRDLQRVVELDSNHLAAIRQLRVYHMRVRHGSLKMEAVNPRTVSGTVARTATPPAPLRYKKS